MTSSLAGDWPIVELSRLAAFGNYPDFDARPVSDLKVGLGLGFAFHLDFNKPYPHFDRWIIKRTTGEGVFLNTDDMDDREFEEVLSWAIDNRLLKPVTYWKLTYREHDQESDVPCWEIKRSRDEADRHIAEMHECDEAESLEPMLVLDLIDELQKFSRTTGYHAGEVASVIQSLFARDVLRTDGVICGTSYAHSGKLIPVTGFGRIFPHAFDDWVWSRV